jgi:hypothetical protein
MMTGSTSFVTGQMASVITSSVLTNRRLAGYGIVSFCGSENNYTGLKTIETYLIGNSVPTASFKQANYQYLNKIKNLNILKINPLISGTISVPEDKKITKTQLLVNYRPDKVAGLGFVIDLENYLLVNSKIFRYLSKNQIFKTKILENSFIDENLSYFFKKNRTKHEKEFKKINNPVTKIRLDDNREDYYVGILDDNKNLDDKSHYSLKANLFIKDYSQQFASLDIRKKILNNISFLKSYKEMFVLYNNNKNIKEANQFIFENEYEINLAKIENFINDIAPIAGFFGTASEEEYASLFVSIFHPLSTRVGLLEKLIIFLNNLNFETQKLIEVNASADDETNLLSPSIKEGYFNYEKYFSIDSLEETDSDFDYDYDYRHGLEVISADTLDNRLLQPAQPIKLFSEAEINLRVSQEANKYFLSPSANTRTTTNYFSLSFIDFDNENYNLILNPPTTDLSFYNNLYARLDDYNNKNLKYKKPEVYYFQLADKGFYAKNVSTRNNKSTNNLLKNTLFDQNQDSRVNSLKYLNDLNLQNFYFLVDENNFKIPLEASASYQYKALLNTSQNETSKFPILNASITNIDIKPKAIIYYNNVFENKLLLAGNNIDVYELSELSVSEFFTKKLRLFNRYFGLQKKVSVVVPKKEKVFNTSVDLKVNIPTKYLNRIVRPTQVNISADLL